MTIEIANYQTLRLKKLSRAIKSSGKITRLQIAKFEKLIYQVQLNVFTALAVKAKSFIEESY